MVRRYLHVTNGTSVTTTLEAAGVPGLRSIWSDPLYEGPVPAGLSDDELREVRERYLGGDVEADPANDMRRWRQVIADHESYDEIVLWFEHDLFDQLNLLQLLSWIRSHLPEGKPVSLICIGSFPGRPAFRGLGELSPGELAPLLETRRPVSAASTRWPNVRGSCFASRRLSHSTIYAGEIPARCRSSHGRLNAFCRNIRGRTTGSREPSAGFFGSRQTGRWS